MNLINFLFLTGALIILANCSHYNGGVFTSIMPDNQTISFRFQVYYIRTGPTTAIFCDDTTIKSQAVVKDTSAASITISYCNAAGTCTGSSTVPYSFRCLNYDIANNWAQFENTVDVALNFATLKNYGYVQFALLKSGTWALFDTYNYYWAHTNRVVADNTPPNVISFPIMNIKCGCEVVFKPLIIDNDAGDFIRCRISDVADKEAGCGTFCTSRFKLNETNCAITFPATLDVSIQVEIQVEDYNANYKNGAEPKSSTSFQFNAVKTTCVANPDCENIPQFTNSLEPSGSTVTTFYDTAYNGKVEAFSTGHKVTEIRIFKDFVGFNYNQASLIYDAGTGISYYDFDIKVSDKSVKQGRAIFQAIDDTGAISEQYIVNYVFTIQTTTSTTTTTTTTSTTTTSTTTTSTTTTTTTTTEELATTSTSVDILNTIVSASPSIIVVAAFVAVVACFSVSLFLIIFFCWKKLCKRSNKVADKDYRRTKTFLR